MAVRSVEAQPHLPVGRAFRDEDVLDRGIGGNLVLVGLGEPVGVDGKDPCRPILAHALDERRGEVVVPAAHRFHDARLHLHHVGIANHLPRRRTDHDVEAREHRFRHASGVVDRRTAVRLLEDLLDTQAHGRGVAIAREVDEARHESAVGVASHEEPGLPALCHLMHRQSHRGEVRGVDLEELLAGVGLEELHDLLARVRARIDVELGHDLIGPRAQERDLADGLRVHRRGVDTEEATLADHPT